MHMANLASARVNWRQRYAGPIGPYELIFFEEVSRNPGFELFLLLLKAYYQFIGLLRLLFKLSAFPFQSLPGLSYQPFLLLDFFQ